MSDKKNSEERKNLFKTWLETLQQESWQLELLISGLALFGVFGAKVLIDDLENFLDIQFLSGVARIAGAIFLFLIKGSWYIFLINLTIHIVLRGLWIGAIGLRYVSNDIDYDELRLSNYFRKLFTRRYQSFDDYIEDLERICSVIFAYTFLLFFILISACLMISWPVLILAFTSQTGGLLLTFIYLMFGSIVFIDFVFLNPLKKIEDKWVSKIYGIIFRFYSTITLSFIFRPILLNFLDSKFTKRLFLFSIPYGAFIIVILPQLTWESQGYFPDFESRNIEYRAYYSRAINPNIYDNLRGDKTDKINLISLKEDKIDGDLLDFFLTQLKSDENFFESENGLSKINRTGISTSFNKKTVTDSAFQALSEQIGEEVTAFITNKTSNKDLFSEEEWNEQYRTLTEKHGELKTAFYTGKIDKIRNTFMNMHFFYIDSIDVTSKVECLMSEQGVLGQKGWRCLINLDSLDNGLHSLIVKRGIYDRRNNIINPVKLEIPFILDR